MAVGSIRQDIPDSDKVETAWLYNRLVFDGDNFKELADKMERWYNVRITIRDTTLNNYHFGGIFENETLEQAFKELQLTFPVQIETETHDQLGGRSGFPIC